MNAPRPPIVLIVERELHRLMQASIRSNVGDRGTLTLLTTRRAASPCQVLSRLV